ncbi:MAG: DUF86 domain-containing protein [Nanoarchaeota archaeon]|nr:DUF86 domain-containing protein [Nanoarchaeota archaeon]MBU4300140.1 DUF86 domain-containing protein [Nanoarchaeota archaeon]MBU4451576.1 DUF86 domain-containing protein [Nanoarchaeota archaeon]MCG2724346.1 DUF86 domain-containing protein [archaeon]
MNKEPLVFVKHIQESMEKIEKSAKELSREDFLNSEETQDATIRRLEIIGEAAKNLPEEFRKKHPEIPWSEIIRTRDKLIHGYFGVDINLTYDIVKNDLPALKEKVKQILEKDSIGKNDLKPSK